MHLNRPGGADGARPLPPFAEFATLMALTMGLGALAIDNLLPAFVAIARDYPLAAPNDIQLLIYVFMVGFGLMQIVYGPLSDSFGRKPTLTLGLLIYAAGTALAIFAGSYQSLLVARFIQGMGAAAPRVLVTAVIRDCFDGREMARAMSLVMMIFIVVPVFAPAFGSLILAFSGWRAIFVGTLALGVVVIAWHALRMPETLHPQHRHRLSARRIARDMWSAMTTRQTIGYATAMGLVFGCLMAYIGSAQQIFATGVYKLGAWFPLAFGLIAACIGAASFLSARLVRRVGMRRLSHGGLAGLIVGSLLNLAIALAFDGAPPLPLFGVGLTFTLCCLALTLSNFNALAMEPVGAIAGAASSIIGVYSTLIGVAAGGLIGAAFNGSVAPLMAGYLALGLLALMVVALTERGRLFQPADSAPSRN